jgi:hypothetical protein
MRMMTDSILFMCKVYILELSRLWHVFQFYQASFLLIVEDDSLKNDFSIIHPLFIKYLKLNKMVITDSIDKYLKLEKFHLNSWFIFWLRSQTNSKLQTPIPCKLVVLLAGGIWHKTFMKLRFKFLTFHDRSVFNREQIMPHSLLLIWLVTWHVSNQDMLLFKKSSFLGCQ